MKIQLSGDILPPETECRSGGPGLPTVITGDITLKLTPNILREMLLHGCVKVPGLCEFELQRDSDSWFVNIQVKKGGIVSIKTRYGHLLPGSKQQVADRIRKLLQCKGLNLVLTEKQNKEFEYPIADLFQNKNTPQ